MQQKTIPNYATHGNTYNSSILKPTGASHSHLHKPKEKNKRKGVATSLCASSLFATAPELVPRACTCRRPARRPARSDRLVVKRRALRPVSAVSGPRAARLAPGSPFLVVDGNREGCADSGHRSPLASRNRAPDKSKQVKRGQKKKESTHAHRLAEVKKKSPSLLSAMMGMRRKKHGEAMFAGGERWWAVRCWWG